MLYIRCVAKTERAKGGDHITDAKKLKEAIVKSGLKIQFIASMIGLSRQGISLKINGKKKFLSEEMFKIADLLKLNDSEMREIFFAQGVDETEP